MTDNQVVVITGARKGIGRNLAEFYCSKGCTVVGFSRSSSDLTDPNYTHLLVDIRDETEVRKAFRKVRKDFNRVDVLINNAGIASMNHFMLTPLSTTEEIFNTNFIGTYLCCREAAKIMQARRFGRIVNLVSVATPLKLEGESIYASSKAAVLNFTQIIARELGELGITVNAIGPTPISTDLIKNVPGDKLDSLLDRQAIKRYGQFRDVSHVIDFFISPESDFVTGQVIYLGGV